MIQTLFISPRNQLAQNERMLKRSNCKALFFAGEMLPIAEALKNADPDMIYQSIATLAELLETPSATPHYPYDKTFDEAENEPCLILHSSGSTGDPKLVTMTHGTFAVTDNDRNMPVPEGRKPQNAAQFNFEGGGRFYSCFPPYHV
jgi:acyl-coenzyme A synthetase/AMP-(fatty) acid ligase